MSAQPIQPLASVVAGVRDSVSHDLADDDVTHTMVRSLSHLDEVTQTYVALPAVAPAGLDAVSTPRPAPALPERATTRSPVAEPPAVRVAAVNASTTRHVLTERETQIIAERLGVDPAQVPHLIELAQAQLANQGVSLDALIAVAASMDVKAADALAAVIALVTPPRGEETPAPKSEPALILAIYVTVFAAERFSEVLPPADALRVAATGADPLSRMAPESIALAGLAVGRIATATDEMTRPEAYAAVSNLMAICPQAVADAVRNGTLDAMLADARRIAESRGDVGNRGQALAAAFVLLTTTETTNQAAELFARTVSVAYGAAPQVILSSAKTATRTATAEAVRRAAVSDKLQRDVEDDRAWDDRIQSRLNKTLDRLGPFLDAYDKLIMTKLNAIPRAELVTALHAQLTRGGEQFYVALLSLLRRHSALCTRQGSRALRNLIVSADERGSASPLPAFA